MTTEIATQEDQAHVDQAMRWLMRLPQLPPSELPAMAEVEATVSALSQPCNETWCMARVAALLSPYYDNNTPAGVRRMEAEDWLEELSGYPQWAIERAVRWWKSADNKDRRKKPLEGDIAARCKVEMGGIGSLPGILRKKVEGTYIEPKEQKRKRGPTDEEKAAAAKLLAEAGFAPKRMGGEA